MQASTGLQWLTYIIDETKMLIDQGMDYKWLKQVLEYLKAMKATVTAAKFMDKYDLNGTVETDPNKPEKREEDV